MTAIEVQSRAPRGPWGSFPVTELAVLAALVLGGLGALAWGSDHSLWLASAAMLLGGLAGIKVAAREHLTGHRSHSGVLAGATVVPISLPLLIVGFPPAAIGALCGVVFLVVFVLLRGVFARRTKAG